MTPRQTDPRVRRLHRRPWSRSLPTALGGGIQIDAPIIRGKIDPAGQLRGASSSPASATSTSTGSALARTSRSVSTSLARWALGTTPSSRSRSEHHEGGMRLNFTVDP
jgi:hypothetical protein